MMDNKGLVMENGSDDSSGGIITYYLPTLSPYLPKIATLKKKFCLAELSAEEARWDGGRKGVNPRPTQNSTRISKSQTRNKETDIQTLIQMKKLMDYL